MAGVGKWMAVALAAVAVSGAASATCWAPGGGGALVHCRSKGVTGSAGRIVHEKLAMLAGAREQPRVLVPSTCTDFRTLATAALATDPEHTVLLRLAGRAGSSPVQACTGQIAVAGGA